MTVHGAGLILLEIVTWVVLAAASVAAYLSRTPLLVAMRPCVAAISTITLCAVAAVGLGQRRRSPLFGRAVVLLACLSLGTSLWRHSRFFLAKRQVQASSSPQLARFGPHVIIGLRSVEEAVSLAQRGAIGGIYLQRPFVAGKSIATIREEISRVERAARLPPGLPFIVMADQEGGVVAHLSPPLPRPSRLADLVSAMEDDEGGSPSSSEELEAAVVAYARSQGTALGELGVDLNLAPVVDLRTGTVVEMDMYSRIADRAISANPLTVALVADWYCRGLADSGVGCTLKHFPGLGRLSTDSHFFLGDLSGSPAALRASDWIPFASAAGRRASRTAVMVSHVRVPDLDADRPASLSPVVVGNTLRRELGFFGLVVTDDMSMFPISGRTGGVARAACEALSAGVDLLLISYDADLYYEAMAGLLDDCGAEVLDGELAVSDERLRRWQQP